MKYLTIKRFRHLAFTLTIAMLTQGFAATNAVAADPYPSKPVTVMVPFSAGGFTDIMARLLSKLLSEQWNAPVVVENVTGAGGNLGAAKVARAAADGYTLLVSNTATNSINQFIYSKIGFDPVKSFEPVVLIIKTPNVVVVNKDVPADSVGDLVKLIKADPEKYNYGSSGVGTTAQLTGALFQDAAGVKIQHIPYKGSSGVMTALQGNFVQMAFDNSVAWAPLIEAGRVKALAIASLKRSSLMPNVPTMDEAGFKEFETSSWFGISAPLGTPKPIIEKLNADINAVLRMPEFVEKMKGGEIVGGTPEEYGKFIVAEAKKWEKAVALSGVEKQ
ncbi:tripartite tricarboxylate transporter substrate binding protein [Allopusillimonas soli]|uniref:Tripartite tricarboxylate transporter substrate binding protein n=1 Tax=Allopusillimonas soli TaxID=659016 RepID=A0A853FJR3_9BURK|nr:tripartite tricarboxylate transporter substrate binding protein [Allopusillimonas soli]NYT38176.1 tripartite tricarboxylate transporter substrate binding protein [Allopusillimonas soli]TEA74048.1 tripartite tricarboxylate transporter substrate binding protein [Allopusillimonas soli]